MKFSVTFDCDYDVEKRRHLGVWGYTVLPLVRTYCLIANFEELPLKMHKVYAQTQKL